MIRRGTEEDINALVAMGLRFAHDLYHDQLPVTADSLDTFVCAVLDNPKACLFVSDGPDGISGVIVGHVFTHPMSGEDVAAELAWWVNPEARGAGVRLLRAFEDWAEAMGARQVQMVAPTERVGAFYERVGYAPVERLYQRSIT